MTIFRIVPEAAVVRIERLGPCHRIVFATPGVVYDDDAHREMVAVAKIVLTDEALRTLLSAVPQYMAARTEKRGEVHVN